MASVGEASSSSPPPASVPPPRRSCTYDVFLSFRGEDTRNGITSHLNAALVRRGIQTFIDDKGLETGEVIKDELLKAIEESMFAITVFSPKYASSSWCLDELHKIVECREKMGLSIVPVFYDVEPCHVRHQKGRFGDAFKTQEDRFGQNSENVRRWRDALVQVANVSGFDFKDEKEADLVERIADHVHKKVIIARLPSSKKNLVGIDSRVKEVISLINNGLNDDVRYIGIGGMGGIGKTTIATVVYKTIRGEFKYSCFLADVREAHEKNQLVEKQKALLAQANISVKDDEHDIQIKIQTSFRNTKVLLVLDDVSDETELEKLAGEQDWFGPGSRIIITTRNARLLNIYEAQEIYEVLLLDHNESLELFCLIAFKQEKPAQEYLDLSKEVVEYCSRLPLALVVLGSYLYKRPIKFWHSTIEQIKSTQDIKIHKQLKISYDNLGSLEKDVFLHIACFFKGKKKDYVTHVLSICDDRAESCIDSCIDILIERSLVTIIEESNVFEMHDLLQDMGRNIVIQESPNDPGKRSRLWSSKDTDRILENNKGSEAIQGIVLSAGWFGRQWSAEAFSNMTQLKLLIIDWYGEKYEVGDLSSLPTSLKVLHWRGCPLKTLPLSDQQYELVEIRLSDSYIRNLWHGKKFLGKLKYLNLSNCWYLEQTPDLSGLPILKTLLLKSCQSLNEVHPSVVHHKSLTLLDLTECKGLEDLPGKLEMSSLNELILDGCSSFKNLPKFGECMKILSRLSLTGTYIKELPTSLGCLAGLEHLNLPGCRYLECLPDITDGIPSLRTLNLSYCNLTEDSFPPDFGPFPSLTDLDLSGNDFVSLPINIHDIPKLKCLDLSCCKKLKYLPELPSSIRKLEAWECWSLDISKFNILSTVCGAFVSPSQDPGQVLLEMLIPGREIPSCFDYRQGGNSVSIPYDYPRNERLGIALCFLPIHYWYSSENSGKTTYIKSALVAHNSNIFKTIRISPGKCGVNHLYIICLTNDYFSDEFHQGTCFEVLLDCSNPEEVVMPSAARCVSKEDIKDLEKSVIERPQ